MSTTLFTGVSDVLQRAHGLGGFQADVDPDPRSATMQDLAMHDLAKTFRIVGDSDVLLTILLDHGLTYFDVKRFGDVCKALRAWVQVCPTLNRLLFRGGELPKPNSPIRLHPALALSKSFISNKHGGIYLIAVKPISARIKKARKGKGQRPKFETRNVAHRPHKTFPVHRLSCASEKATSPPTAHLVIRGIGSSAHPDDIPPIEINNTTGVTVLDVLNAVVERWTSQQGDESEWKKMWKSNEPTGVWSGWAGLEVKEDGRVELKAKTFGRRHRPGRRS
ncbi:hypothetical protein RQP46_001960 [Phenoliferia psychrophenolica]